MRWLASPPQRLLPSSTAFRSGRRPHWQFKHTSKYLSSWRLQETLLSGIIGCNRVFSPSRRPQMRQPLEQELIGRMQAGDSTAVGDLASTYGPRIHQLAFRYLKNWEDAEEVTQDVLMKVHRKIDAFRGDAALSSWIYRITFNTAMSRLRNGRFSRPHEVSRQETLSTDAPTDRQQAQDPADWSSLADDRVLRGQLRDRLIQALTHLPEVYRVPVILRDIN